MVETQISVGVVGASGYAGAELLRLIAEHPNATVTAVTSRANAGKSVFEVFSSIHRLQHLLFTEPSVDNLKTCDVVFFSTPHGVAMNMARELLNEGVKIVDLSADFRLKNAQTWAKWYGMEHACPDLLKQAVYGLPELHRESIKSANLVANPGCYPTANLLGAMPLIKAGLVDVTRIISDSKSGVSGAGRGANVGNLYAEVAENFKAYAVSGHRHLPEIAQEMQYATADEVDLTFTPHLLPMVRGIEATLYLETIGDVSDEQLQSVFEQAYVSEPFVDVLPAGAHPTTGCVRGTNSCRLAVHRPGQGKRVVVLSVIDNLIKGAAGQAIQNMNLMFDLPETTGLTALAVWP